MLKYLDIRHHSIALKIGLWGFILMLFMLILALLNNNQLRLLGAETSIIDNQEVPAINALQTLEGLIYQQTILRLRIYSEAKFPNANGNSTIAIQTAIDAYGDLSIQVREAHQRIENLMQGYARLLMPSDSIRWQRLQAERQQAIQASLDDLAKTTAQHNEIVQQGFASIRSGRTEEAKNLELHLKELDELLHQELGKLSAAAYSGVTNSGKKIHNVVYGARQITFFLLFWFYLIGIVAGSFLIKMIVSTIKTATGFAKDIADGNCSDRVDVKSQDELGCLLQELNRVATAFDKSKG